MRILILGGTMEASRLARLIADDGRFSPTLSLAGRTASPAVQPVPTRIGGFGGADGLARWLQEDGAEAIIDATHPFAARISANAASACDRLGLPFASLMRPAWGEGPGDRWEVAASAEAAARMLAERPPARVFLSVGRLELAVFVTAPAHRYIARTIDPPGAIALPPRIRFIFERGPFEENAERTLLTRERIDAIVSKNSGGAATYGKIAAARDLELPVIMIARPEKRRGQPLDSPADAIRWLGTLGGHGAILPSRRGV